MEPNANPRRLPTIYIPHGGGPWHVMGDASGDSEGYERLRAYLASLGERYSSYSKAILVISAHWEEVRPTVHFGAHPSLLYDYYGFPDFTYRLQWPAPGSPQVAGRVEKLLTDAAFKCDREEKRGFDHGTFVPFMIAFPEAHIPVVQLSLVKGLDPAIHYTLGEALEPLRSEGVLIIGSGMSYHNIRAFMSQDPRRGPDSEKFDRWLSHTVTMEDPKNRREALIDWKAAPAALACHPRSEHLLPLMVVAGAAKNEKGRQDYTGRLMGAAISSYIFGDDIG